MNKSNLDKYKEIAVAEVVFWSWLGSQPWDCWKLSSSYNEFLFLTHNEKYAYE